MEEEVEMYDTDGNRLYQARCSLEDAQQLVKKLKQKGIDAVIGPRPPVDIYGKTIEYEHDNSVGVYIVKEDKEKEKDKEKDR